MVSWITQGHAVVLNINAETWIRALDPNSAFPCITEEAKESEVLFF